MSLNQVGEFGLISRLQKLLQEPPGTVYGIGDDAAVLPYTRSSYLLFTTDMLVEGVDFLSRMPARGVGYKAIACNISDIAAMGGEPTHAVVALGLPTSTPVSRVEELYRGIDSAARRFGVGIVGGDISAAGKMVVSIAMLGRVEKRNLVTRRGAAPGDWIFVTGPLGGSYKSGRHLTFTPRVEQARFLAARFKPSAMIDISDGLAGDLNHILKASGVGARLDMEVIPRHEGVSIAQALSDGEDYELLFTMPPAKAGRLMAYQSRRKAFYFYPIGVVTADKKQVIHAQSYRHF